MVEFITKFLSLKYDFFECICKSILIAWSTIFTTLITSLLITFYFFFLIKKTITPTINAKIITITKASMMNTSKGILVISFFSENSHAHNSPIPIIPNQNINSPIPSNNCHFNCFLLFALLIILFESILFTLLVKDSILSFKSNSKLDE